MPDILFISLENWDDIWRRNQFVCAALARRHPESRIVFVGVPRNFGQLLRRGAISAMFSSGTETLKEFPNITITRPPRVGPEAYDWGLRLNEQLFRNHVAREAAALYKPVLWINSHWAYHLVPGIRHSSLIYDITDDWLTSSQPELDRRRTLHADRLLCEQADATIVCSEKLYQLKREMTRSIHLIPNGVDADHYASIPDRTLAVAPQIARLPRPVLGYTGTLHEDRLDLNLLMQIAQGLTDRTRDRASAGDAGSIALVGPSHLTSAQTAALTATGKIHLLPAVPYQRIPEIMRGFDVCITPHRVTPFTESLNPIKLWEYLASGKPIISTPVAGFRDYAPHVHIAKTSREFIAAVATVMAENPAAVATRQAEARKHSWNARVDQIEMVIKETLAQTEIPQPQVHSLPH